jgi:hypothetical protein
MQATHGPSRRRGRARLLGWLLGLAALAAVIMPTAASAVPPPTETYLALGDSLAFGFSKQAYHEGEAAGFENPELFEHGYPSFYLKSLQAKDLKIDKETGAKLYVKGQNDGCPGETTESLIGKNETLIGTLNFVLKKTQEEHHLPPIKGESPCAYQAGWNAFHTVGVGGPLHHPYPHSQLEDALNTIVVAKKVETPVTTISLNINGNDALHVLGKIEAEAKTHAEEYFVEHKTQLEKEGKEEAERQYVKHKAKYDKEGEEAGLAYYHEHETEVNNECGQKAFVENGDSFEEPGFREKFEACVAAKVREKATEAIEAKLAAYGQRAVEFKLGAVGEEFASEKIKEALLPLVAQMDSNILGTLVAIRQARTLHLKGEGGERYTTNYRGKIIFQGLPNFFGKQFNLALEGVGFVKNVHVEAFTKCSEKAFGENGNSEAEPEFAKKRAACLGVSEAAFTKCSERASAENAGAEAQPGFKEKREACVAASAPIVAPYALDLGRCGEHATELEFEEEAIAEGCIAASLVVGSNSLDGVINLTDHETVASVGSCYTDPQLRFNPQTAPEPNRLKKWTEMTNATATTVGTVIKFNGPDVHMTFEGYKELAAEMVKEEIGTCHEEKLPGF